jgi:hypothetical protein
MAPIVSALWDSESARTVQNRDAGSLITVLYPNGLKEGSSRDWGAARSVKVDRIWVPRKPANTRQGALDGA